MKNHKKALDYSWKTLQYNSGITHQKRGLENQPPDLKGLPKCNTNIFKNIIPIRQGI